jgi:hypothetical protein
MEDLKSQRKDYSHSSTVPIPSTMARSHPLQKNRQGLQQMHHPA